MERVTGIGGIFFKSSDPAALSAWYAANLGIQGDEAAGGAVMFRWRPVDDDATVGTTVWSPFPANTGYFDPTRVPFMVNYRVADLDRMLAQLRAAGAQVDERVEDTEYGRFGWAVDPDGTRFELWQPPAGE